MSDFGPPEHVYVESGWYDGPRAGIADVEGRPHRYQSLNDEKEGEYLGTFVVWPIDPSELKVEQEQWQIFASWNRRYECGQVSHETHPGHPGTNQRWDEIDALLKDRRDAVPPNARRMKVQLVNIERTERYAMSGPDYQLRWEAL